VGVAGWLGTFDNFIGLESRWRNALPPSANGYFHYTDFWNSPKSYGAKWSKEERIEHVKTLASIARDCTTCAVGIVISSATYDELIPSKDRIVLKSPIHFCLAQCLTGLLEIYKELRPAPPAPLRVMFDRKKGQEGTLAAIYYTVRELFDKDHILGDMSFGSSKLEVPLQAADLLIGELRRTQAGHESVVMDVLREKRSLLVAFPKDDEFRAYLKNVLANLKKS